jgi:hypothetical protein
MRAFQTVWCRGSRFGPLQFLGRGSMFLLELVTLPFL